MQSHIVFELVDTKTGRSIASFPSKVGALRTYKEIIKKIWVKSALHGFTEIKRERSVKVVGVYYSKDAHIDTTMVNRRILVYQVDGPPDITEDKELEKFLSKCGVSL